MEGDGVNVDTKDEDEDALETEGFVSVACITSSSNAAKSGSKSRDSST